MSVSPENQKSAPRIQPAGKVRKPRIVWLAFNQRVLEEASNPHHPVLERLRFCQSRPAISTSFHGAVAGLVEQANAGVEVKSQDDLTPAQQLERVTEVANALMMTSRKRFNLLADLRDAGIFVHEEHELAPDQISWLEGYFLDQVLPVLTPLAIDPAHVSLHSQFGVCPCPAIEPHADDNRMNALLLVPQQLDHFVAAQGRKKFELHFVRLRHWCRCSSSAHFRDKVLGQGVFRIIRDSDIEEEAEDLVQLFESALSGVGAGRLSVEN